jgi:Phage shock protein A (IM30), suppresses sigma54-dependent transcription
MTGILKRFGDIMSANINSLLDKAEDPGKMIDQYLRNLESDLGKVKAETASVMAEATKTKRQLDECSSDIAKMQSYAEKAVIAGNDQDARQFLEKKNQLLEQQANIQTTYDLANDNAAKMKEMHDKLATDISSLNARKDTIKSKLAVAKTQETLNKVGNSVAGAKSNLSAFDKMEAKADKMLDEANAMRELNESGKDKDINALADKYSDINHSVEDDLAALKAKLGQ